MTAKFSDDELLLLSGIQHYAFCERQWGLIHVEQLWAENRLTIEGQILHRRADDPFETESRGDRLVTRSMPLVSYRLGYYGVADIVEFHRAESGYQSDHLVKLAGHRGLWTAFPIEYKRGREKHDDWDEIQLCAQAIALEEMLSTAIPSGSLFYGELRRRHPVKFSDELRDRVDELFRHMRRMLDNGFTPKAKFQPKCRNCSLLDLCAPKALSSKPVDLFDFVDQLSD